MIILALLLFILIIFGALYYQLKTNGLRFATGNLIIDVNIDETKETKNIRDSNISIIEEDLNETNLSLIITENNKSLINNTDLIN